MLDIYSVIVYPLVYIFPAYAANGIPVLLGGGAPLDFGKRFRGKRIFGDNKTIRGTSAAIAAGIIAGLAEYQFLNYMLAIAVLLTLGAVFGDLLGSFIKRRMNMKSGANLWMLDQYGFFIFALLFALPLGNLPNIYGLIFIIMLTGILHLATNIAAHRLKLKSVPW